MASYFYSLNKEPFKNHNPKIIKAPYPKLVSFKFQRSNVGHIAIFNQRSMFKRHPFAQLSSVGHGRDVATGSRNGYRHISVTCDFNLRKIAALGIEICFWNELFVVLMGWEKAGFGGLMTEMGLLSSFINELDRFLRTQNKIKFVSRHFITKRRSVIINPLSIITFCLLGIIS